MNQPTQEQITPNFQRVAFFAAENRPFVANISLDQKWVMVFNPRTKTLRGISPGFKADDLQFDDFGKLTMSNDAQALTICTRCWLDGDCRCDAAKKS